MTTSSVRIGGAPNPYILFTFLREQGAASEEELASYLRQSYPHLDQRYLPLTRVLLDSWVGSGKVIRDEDGKYRVNEDYESNKIAFPPVMQ